MRLDFVRQIKVSDNRVTDDDHHDTIYVMQEM